MMNDTYASIWHHLPLDFASRIETCVDAACSQLNETNPVSIFFRADDIAVPEKQFVQLFELFLSYRVPLSLAVVPAWITKIRWQTIKSLANKAPKLWCWHQHGWRHMNHESKGKKQEFGPGRSVDPIRKDLLRGRERLEMVLGNAFYPAFTPPWNRCDLNTLELLKKFKYRAVSRSQNSKPLPPHGLPDFSVNIDLHTRKEANPIEAWNHLFTELVQSISSGFCGIMLHHQRMNKSAFIFLELLLKALIKGKYIRLINLKDLVENRKHNLAAIAFLKNL